MELRQLRYFLAIAQELHFGRAARALHLSQPALSQSLAQLERELGVELVERDKRRVTVTAAGRAFRAQARRTVDAADQAVRAAQRAGSDGARELHLGFLDTATFWPLPQALEAFRRIAPRIDVILHHAHGEELLELLAHRELDGALCRITGANPAIEFLPMCPERLVLLVADGHPLGERTSVSVTDLQGHPLVMPRRRGASDHHDRILTLCAGAGFEPVIAAEASSVPVMLHLVATGVGACMLTETVAGWHRTMPITSVPLDAPGLRAGLALATCRVDRSPAVEQLMAVCSELAEQAQGTLSSTRDEPDPTDHRRGPNVPPPD